MLLDSSQDLFRQHGFEDMHMAVCIRNEGHNLDFINGRICRLCKAGEQDIKYRTFIINNKVIGDILRSFLVLKIYEEEVLVPN